MMIADETIGNTRAHIISPCNVRLVVFSDYFQFFFFCHHSVA